MANRYLEKIAAWSQKEPGLQYDESSNSYRFSREKVLDLVKEDEKSHVSRGIKTFASLGGLTGAAIGAAKSGVSGAIIGGVTSAALGALAGSALANGGNKQSRDNHGYLKNKATIYLGHRYDDGWEANVELDKIAALSENAEKVGYGTAATGVVAKHLNAKVAVKKARKLDNEFGKASTEHTSKTTRAQMDGDLDSLRQHHKDFRQMISDHEAKTSKINKRYRTGNKISKALTYGGLALGIAGSISGSKESK